MNPDATDTVVLRGGLAVPLRALRLCWDLEARGLKLEPDGEGFRVSPASRITPAEDAALRTYRDAVIAIVKYCETIQ